MQERNFSERVTVVLGFDHGTVIADARHVEAPSARMQDTLHSPILSVYSNHPEKSQDDISKMSSFFTEVDRYRSRAKST